MGRVSRRQLRANLLQLLLHSLESPCSGRPLVLGSLPTRWRLEVGCLLTVVCLR
jgi:hypothetical protein